MPCSSLELMSADAEARLYASLSFILRGRDEPTIACPAARQYARDTHGPGRDEHRGVTTHWQASIPPGSCVLRQPADVAAVRGPGSARD